MAADRVGGDQRDGPFRVVGMACHQHQGQPGPFETLAAHA